MGAIFSKILGTASEPSASPILAVEGDITCCNCEESSSDSDAGTSKKLGDRAEDGGEAVATLLDGAQRS